jgi:hypothetical protein
LQARPVAPAKQLQQDEHPLVRTQGGEQSNLIVQRALQKLQPAWGSRRWLDYALQEGIRYLVDS